MTAALKALVRRRAQFRCEYCRFPERLAELRFQLDHILARKHGGPATAENLAFACFRCNSHKGPNLSGTDPDSGELTRLFHPRSDEWKVHFRWRRAVLVGKTPIGRATIAVLNMNRPDVVALRKALLAEGVRF
jgi:5-methylcytosine-specific restriction endonuclease McrA